MKQITYFILLLSFIVYISTTCSDMTTKDSCLSYTLTDLEKQAKWEFCCFISGLSGEFEEFNGCEIYTSKSAKETKKTVKAAKGKIDCNSNWLNLDFSIVFLVLFF